VTTWRCLDIIVWHSYDVLMRTTLTLDPDVAATLKAIMKKRGVTMKEAINEALRRGLTSGTEKRAPFRVRAHDCGGFQPGIDASKLGQLADELHADAFTQRTRR
jgi:hypothetical protein